jgi:5-(carboxyamino)imidazole ribonucleotide mutase
MTGPHPEIAVVMGNETDMLVMQETAKVLDQFGVQYEIDILFTHQDPERMINFAKTALTRKVKVIIAGASGAAHLPGVIAAYTPLPVIGVPIKADYSIDGLDAIYSILQMPQGVPVATMALNGARNAAIFALQILGVVHDSYFELVSAYKNKIKGDAGRSATQLSNLGYERFVAGLK